MLLNIANLLAYLQLIARASRFTANIKCAPHYINLFTSEKKKHSLQKHFNVCFLENWHWRKWNAFPVREKGEIRKINPRLWAECKSISQSITFIYQKRSLVQKLLYARHSRITIIDGGDNEGWVVEIHGRRCIHFIRMYYIIGRSGYKLTPDFIHNGPSCRFHVPFHKGYLGITILRRRHHKTIIAMGTWQKLSRLLFYYHSHANREFVFFKMRKHFFFL